MRSAVIAFLAIFAVTAPVPAFAHGFQLGVVAPLSGLARASGLQALDGLILATQERDGHPDETSDGHLGGLDSHLRPIDSEMAANPAWLRDQVSAMRLDIVTVVGPASEIAAIAGALATSSAVFCPPAGGPVPPGTLESPEATAFVAAFRTAFGYSPSAAAAQGYNAGRAVDAAVRALGGVADMVALKRFCLAGN